MTQTKYRTHTCGELRMENVGQTVTVAGWLENLREVGSNLGFLVLRESNAVLRKTVKTAAGDSGYGLVICEDVMSALGGSVSHGTEDGRFCIVLRFPILPGRE